MKYIFCVNCDCVKEFGVCEHSQENIAKHERKFTPYYDRVLGSWVHSWAEAEKKGLEHRSPSHPEGLRMIQGDHKQIKEYRNIKRYKEDYKRAEYGSNYKLGDKIFYDEARKPRGTVFSYNK